MSTRMPSLALAAVAGRRKQTLELAGEIENRGFSGIYCASFGDGMALCEALAFATETIEFGTSIQPIYTRHVSEFANMASFIHEVSGGRFRFGIGVSHAPALSRMERGRGHLLGPRGRRDRQELATDLRATTHPAAQR